MNPMTILCFGDSLTWGFSNGGFTQHPYALELQSSLMKYFPKDSISMDNRGQSGDLVISPPGGFLPRMGAAYSEVSSPYTWAIILGGTNDLGWGKPGDEIYSALQKVWNIPLSHGTNVLAVTVPECDCSSDLADRREYVNSHILNHTQENFYTFDLFHAIPWASMDDEQRALIWDDGVHFTPQGYDLLGSMLADRIVELVQGRQEMGAGSDDVAEGVVRQKPLVEEEDDKKIKQTIIREDEVYAD
ncbi:hypothetical protein BP6252_02012 [Coleophoma cylindrospora]|uniref:SGNH hydrolase-type esterase domain-containing protein n=1 Tax=Coleophoma cylindrospora TaxID=1849047 RepID=A0A3D8SDM5_9HELO|nr:hypothetical protein BP6252_02012 [Coleophoma cylindrospora]